MNNYQLSTWSKLFNQTIYGWNLNLINSDYSLVIDVSHWEYDKAKFDKEKFKAKALAMNLRALIFKLSDTTQAGFQFYDSSAEFWYNLANECGLLTSGYHWLQPSIDPTVAYRFYEKWIKDHPFTLPQIVDFEEPSARLKPTDYLWRLQTFLGLSGPNSIVYTSPGYISDLRANGANASRLGFAANYALWVATYSRYKPCNFAPWTDWVMWQYSDAGDFPIYRDGDAENGLAWGMPGAGLDMSWAKNSYLDQFKNSSSVEEIPPVVPAETTTPAASALTMIAKTVLKIRTGPGIGYLEIGELQPGAEVEVLDVAGKNAWIQHQGGWSCAELDNLVLLEKKP